MAELLSQPASIQSVFGWFNEGRLYVNRRYQRKLVWTLEEKQKLIESILCRYPIPAILLAEKNEDPQRYEIIDGLQRLHTIMSFIETSFETADGKNFDLEHFTSAKNRADAGFFVPTSSTSLLNQTEVSRILDYNIAVSIMRNATDSEVNDVFGRINTYGHRLSDQERRQAGVQHEFANTVRAISCGLRGDTSSEVLPLDKMPSISIDLPKTKHGYDVQAEEVFWVAEGILRSTDLRDSMDEQCVADILACLASGEPVDRSKAYLDELYTPESDASKKIQSALQVYGPSKLLEEFKFCIDQILELCHLEPRQKLRNVIYESKTTNPFPSVFASIVIAFHELIIKESKVIADKNGLRSAMTNLTSRIETSRKSTRPDERKKNINAIKGLIASFFVPGQIEHIYGNHSITDIESDIRRSRIELPNYELKQGVVALNVGERKLNPAVFQKVIQTICAISNNGPNRSGKIIIGVANDKADAELVHQLDGIIAKEVGGSFIVGVEREAKILGETAESYFQRWRNEIHNSELSTAVKANVLSNLDYNSYFGLGLIVISVPSSNELSYVGDDLYWRNGDQTELVTGAKQIADIAKRFP